MSSKWYFDINFHINRHTAADPQNPGSISKAITGDYLILSQFLLETIRQIIINIFFTLDSHAFDHYLT